jgi:antitoxin component of MazEF toxin-antitoxin module
MGVRKQSEQNIRKLTKLGGKSLAVTLPVKLVAELGWREKQKVVVKRVRGGLLIKDWKRLYVQH